MKISIYLFVFGTALVLLTSGHLIVFYKYIQVLMHHTLYACQVLANTLSLQLPSLSGWLVAGIVTLAIVILSYKVIRSIIAICTLRNTLAKRFTKIDKDIMPLLRSLDLIKQVVIVDQAKPEAFCFGIRRPKIYISSGLVDLTTTQELTVILRHEKYHLDHRDTLTMFLASIAEAIFPFFPVVSDFVDFYRTEREIKADRAAILTKIDQQSLKHVLIKLIKYEPAKPLRYLPTLLSADTLEARIRSLHNMNTVKKSLNLRNTLISLFSLGVLLGLMATPLSAVELHEGDQDFVVLCTQPTLSFFPTQSIPYSSHNYSSRVTGN